jgi:Cohesin domain
MKKLSTSICFLFIISFCAQAQTNLVQLSVGENTVTQGDTISLPVRVSNFSNIYSIGLCITYDPTTIMYQGASQFMLLGMIESINFNEPVPGRIMVSYFTNAPQTIAQNSSIFNLNFRVTGQIGDSTAIQLGEGACSFFSVEITNTINGNFVNVWDTANSNLGYVKIITSGVDEAIAQPVMLAPNPNSGVFRIAASGFVWTTGRIFDPQGRVVAKLTEGQDEIDLSAAPAGLYTIHLLDSQGRIAIGRTLKW